ncbi:hypothetical protein [Streptomyces sp. NPDC054804]
MGIQAGAFLHLNTPESTGQAQAAYGASFTDALHTCALVGGIGMLVAAVIALALIGIRPARVPQATAEATAHPAGAAS